MHDAVAKVDNTVGFDHAGAFEVELAIFEVVEETDATAKNNGDEVQVNLVEKAGLEVLLSHVGGTDGNIPLASDATGLFESALDAIGDDGAAGARADVLIGRLVGEKEEGGANGMVATPAVGDVESTPSRDDRPALEHFLHDGAAARGWLEAVVWTDTLGAGGPPVEEPVSTVAEGVVGTVVWAGNKAIQ